MSEAGDELLEQARALCLVEPPDYDAALTLLRRAAEPGCAEAIYALGDWHHRGRAVEQDDEQAFAYTLRAAELGYGPAMENLAISLETGCGCAADLDEALHWYEKAADCGQHEAAYDVGRVLEQQRQCYDETVVAWYRRSADAGYDEAQYAMGYLYEFGYAVELNTETAARWYRIAAAQGHEGAIDALVDMPDDEASSVAP